MKDKQVKDLTLTALLLALGIIIPSIFHTVGALNGKIFLPMHLPVLLGGILLPINYALILGLLTPALNSLLIGMPPFFPSGLLMVFELGAYGLVTALLYHKFKQNIFVSLIVGMISGRVFAGLVVAILATFFNVDMHPLIYIQGAVVTGIPGIIIQLILIPVIVRYLEPYLLKKQMLKRAHS